MIPTVTVALATYGICTLLSEYDAPFNAFANLRAKFRVFGCIGCSSVWISAPLAYFAGLGVIEYLGAIGIVLAIDRLTT